jgi:hypothetical protein
MQQVGLIRVVFKGGFNSRCLFHQFVNAQKVTSSQPKRWSLLRKRNLPPTKYLFIYFLSPLYFCLQIILSVQQFQKFQDSSSDVEEEAGVLMSQLQREEDPIEIDKPRKNQFTAATLAFAPGPPGTAIPTPAESTTSSSKVLSKKDKEPARLLAPISVRAGPTLYPPTESQAPGGANDESSQSSSQGHKTPKGKKRKKNIEIPTKKKTSNKQPRKRQAAPEESDDDLDDCPDMEASDNSGKMFSR